MQKARDARYDYAKFFLICCVVMGHLGNRYSDVSTTVARVRFWVYLFHMPAFVYIAGLFAKRTVREKQWTKAVGFLLIYIYMELQDYVVAGISKGFNKASLDLLHENGISWFALAMCWWFLLTMLVQKADTRAVFAAAVLLAVISGYFKQINSFLTIQRTINFYPFFFAGYATDIKKLGERLRDWPLKAAGAALLGATAIISFLYFDKISFWRNLFRGLKAYANINKDLSSAWGGVWRLGAFVISFALTMAVLALMPSKESFISRLGKRTLAVYVFHWTFISRSIAYIPGLSKWMKQSPIMLRCAALMAVTVLVTSLPVFEWIVRKLMELPEMVRRKLTK